MKHIMGSILLVALGGALAFGASALFSSMSPATPALDSATTVTAEQNYKIGRIQAFLNPESDINGGSLNLYRSLVAIGDGGITGSGIGQGTMKLHYLQMPIMTSFFQSLAKSSVSLEVHCSCSFIFILSGEVLSSPYVARIHSGH